MSGIRIKTRLTWDTNAEEYNNTLDEIRLRLSKNVGHIGSDWHWVLTWECGRTIVYVTIKTGDEDSALSFKLIYG